LPHLLGIVWWSLPVRPCKGGQCQRWWWRFFRSSSRKVSNQPQGICHVREPSGCWHRRLYHSILALFVSSSLWYSSLAISTTAFTPRP
jgi:hypothetical protein